jgi:hypothetical protein
MNFSLSGVFLSFFPKEVALLPHPLSADDQRKVGGAVRSISEMQKVLAQRMSTLDRAFGRLPPLKVGTKLL